MSEDATLADAVATRVAAPPPQAGTPRRRWLARAVGLALLAAVLALGMVGYLHPDMRLDWAALAQLCGPR